MHANMEDIFAGLYMQTQLEKHKHLKGFEYGDKLRELKLETQRWVIRRGTYLSVRTLAEQIYNK